MSGSRPEVRCSPKGNERAFFRPPKAGGAHDLNGYLLLALANDNVAFAADVALATDALADAANDARHPRQPPIAELQPHRPLPIAREAPGSPMRSARSLRPLAPPARSARRPPRPPVARPARPSPAPCGNPDAENLERGRADRLACTSSSPPSIASIASIAAFVPPCTRWTRPAVSFGGCRFGARGAGVKGRGWVGVRSRHEGDGRGMVAGWEMGDVSRGVVGRVRGDWPRAPRSGPKSPNNYRAASGTGRYRTLGLVYRT